MFGIFVRPLATVGIALLALGCSSEEPLESDTSRVTPNIDDNGSDACQAVQQTFIDCELGSLVSNGVLSCDELDRPGSDPCYTHCLAEASCDDLAALVCSETTTLDLEQCASECAQDDALVCEVALPPSWLCDGEDDCIDGSDEDGCPPPFVCDDGTELSESYECDGFEDCNGGEDEAGCPAPFVCDDGLTLPAAWECDGVPDCETAEDEHDDCQLDFTCDSGDVVTIFDECDGEENCPDGSDEHDGCEVFSCDYQLSESYVCNGVPECLDGSDEPDGCELEITFACDDGELVPLEWQCDREEDCSDGSDEQDCPEPRQFTCGDGRKIPATAECDRFIDCADLSDEHEDCWYLLVCTEL